MIRRIISTVFICFGILLLGAAGFLVLQNSREESAAEVISHEVVAQLQVFTQENAAPADPEILEKPDRLEKPDYMYNPDMGMPEKEIDGCRYIGTLEIFDLDLSLPVMSTTSMENLRKAPCRYRGSAYQQNLIIGAHNYDAHFGRLRSLSYGSEIRVTDMDGNQFWYQVADIEILQPEQVEDLVATDWPLTLYTCTVGGQTRVVVRCENSRVR